MISEVRGSLGKGEDKTSLFALLEDGNTDKTPLWQSKSLGMFGWQGHVGDVDGDGAPEVLGLDWSDSVSRVWKTQPEGGYAADGKTEFPAPHSWRFGDLDQDGILDVFAQWLEPTDRLTLAVAPGKQGGGFGATQKISFPDPAPGQKWYFFMEPANIAGDKKKELIAWSMEDTSKIFLASFNGAELSLSSMKIPLDLLKIGEKSGAPTYLIDLDGDGVDDLVIGYAGPPDWKPEYKILINKGEGVFEAGPILPPEVSQPVLADFNNDGRADIVYRREDSPGYTMVVLRGDGKGGFSEEFTLSQQQDPTLPDLQNPLALDVNGDGKMDIVSGGMTLKWWINTSE